MAFWRHHVQVGVLLSVVAALAIWLYAGVWTAGTRGRELEVTCAGALLATGFYWYGLSRALNRRRIPYLWLYGWSVSIIGFAVAAIAIDGGGGSLLTALLYLPLVFVSLAYPWPAVVAFGGLEMGGLVVVSLTDGTPITDRAVVCFTVLAMMTSLTGLAAFNRADSQARVRRLHSLLEERATRDPLTACLNRRGFDEPLDQEIIRATRYCRPLTLCVIDIDHLKSINDSLGHAAGDDAIRLVAKALTTVARGTDLVARRGGDEFAMLLPETGEDEASIVTERIHAQLRRSGTDHPVTVSIGLATIGPGVAPAGSLLDAADSALYVAKESGRNRTARSPA